MEAKRYRFNRTAQIFVFHPLTNVDREKLIAEWRNIDEKRKRRQIPIYRRLFLKYHRELAETRTKLKQLFMSSRVRDAGEAKQWYWVMEGYPFNFQAVEWRANELRLRNVDRRLALETMDWFFCSERLGFLNFLNGRYFQDELMKIKKLTAIPCKKLGRSMQTELAKADSLICTQIRLYFEGRKGLIFKLEELEQLKDAMPKDWKNLLIKQINQFTREINKKFMTRVPKKENKKKMFEITLLQETTKAAFHSIQAYQKMLQNSKQLVVVECSIVEHRLIFNIGHIREQFKAPITALSRVEWTRFSPEDIDNMADRAGTIISAQLDPDKLFQHPAIRDFAHIIGDEKTPSQGREEELLDLHRRTKLLQLRLKKMPWEISSQLFRIKLAAVWMAVQQRLRLSVQTLTVRIRQGFTEELLALQEEFRRYDRALLFRSINPALMLGNKAVVNQILTEEIGPSVKKLVAFYDRIFVITQQISLDPNQHDLLISLSHFRIALPSQIKEHNHFFQKRIASFQSFVTKKQQTVLANAQKVAERLKILQTMANPQEAENYKREVAQLIAPLVELITEIDDLNKFEEVVGVPKTEVPRMRQIATDVRVMEELFAETKAYYDHMNEFFDSRRTVANIPRSRHFIENYLARLAVFESQLAAQRAARHFIANARNDVDVFKRNFAVAEVLSCKRFLDQHWTKMSEIVGFDLSIHANSTMAIICELGLDDVLSQLKPIAFAAEREALISDQLDTAIGHWTKAHIDTDPSPFWNLLLPSNLSDLISQAEKHRALLASSKDAENVYSQLNHEIARWVSTISRLHDLFLKWNGLVGNWLRVARIFVQAKDSLEREYLLFRRCAKYWRRFERVLRQDATALHLLEVRHASCWLLHVEEHMATVVQGVHTHLNVIRLATPRLCLTSDHELLLLFAATSTLEILPLLLREAFPQLRRLFFNRKGQLEISEACSGDSLTLDTVTYEAVEGLGVDGLIKEVERGFRQKVCELLAVSEGMRSVPKMIPALSEVLENKVTTGDCLTIVRAEADFLLLHKLNQAQAHLTLDFMQLDEVRRLPAALCNNWSRGSVLLLTGDLTSTRLLCQAMAQKLFSSVRYVNCHKGIQPAIFEVLAQVSIKESPLLVLENVDELSPSSYSSLNKAIGKMPRTVPFPRLLLTAPTSAVLRNLSPAISCEPAPKQQLEPARQEELVEELVPYATMSPRSPSEETRPIQEGVKQLSELERLGQSIWKGEISAITGPLAKSALREIFGSSKTEVSWLYVDALTDEQIISPGSGFGSLVSGQLLNILREEDTPQTASLPLSDRPTSPLTVQEVRKFVIFYGNDRIWQVLPFVSSLFHRSGQSRLPAPYLSLFDGSTFLAPPSVYCILSIPDDLSNTVRSGLVAKFDLPLRQMGEEAKNTFGEVYSRLKGSLLAAVGKKHLAELVEKLVLHVLEPLVTKKTYIWAILLSLMLQELSDLKGTSTEVLLQGLAVLSANFLKLYLAGDTVDGVITKHWLDTFSRTFPPLPPDLSSWKLSMEDPSNLVRWEDEPYHASSLDREARREDLMVVWPAFDRQLHFGKRILAMGNNLLVTGPPFTQKTTLVKMLQRQLPGSTFQWIPSHARVGLENCQREFAKILEAPGKQATIGEQMRFLVIDKFSFAEPLLPIIELFVDQKIYFSDGQLKKSEANWKFILVCEEEDWINISKTHVFHSTFCHLPMRSVTAEEAKMLVERLLQWNLTAKSFSSEYNKLVEPMASAIVTIANKPYAYLSPLPTCMRLVKGMFFSFPDNAPDTLAFVRLWLHETLRVIGDALDDDFKEQFLSDLRTILFEEFGHRESELFQLGEADHAEGTSYDLCHLLYSELDNNESFDGLNYLPVKNMDHFNRTVENIIFEHHRNNSRDRIRLVVNDFATTSMQAVLRVLRQAGEHACLAGPAGIGRQQTAKLAAAACGASVMHHYPDPSDFDEFRRGWTDIFTRAALAISSSNQPVLLMAHMDYCYERVEPRWMEYVRLWLENPEFDLIGDEQLISMGEQIIENEKSIVSHMQSQGIRLPGQRMVRFLPIEVLKEPDVLRHVLEARVHDLLHVIFTVQPHLKTDFSWCTVIHFKKPSEPNIHQMCSKVLADLKVVESAPILMEIFNVVTGYLAKVRSPGWMSKIVVNWNVLFHLYDQFQLLYSAEKRNLHRRSKRLSEALSCIAKLQDLELYGKSVDPTVLDERIRSNEIEFAGQNRDFHEMSDKVDDLLQKIRTKEFAVEKMRVRARQLDEEIEGKLKQPKEDFQLAVTVLSEYGPAQFKQLSLIARPGLGCRFVAEILRHLLTPNFKPRRNTMETWQESQKFLRSPGLLHRIVGVKPMLLDITTIKTLNKYIEHREFKEGKIEGDSKLAAVLCNWTYTLIQLAVSSSLLKEKQAEMRGLQQETAETEAQIVAWKKETETLQEEIGKTEKLMRDIEISLSNDRKLKDYQSRATPILEALAPFYRRWRNERGVTETQENRLFANCVLQSVFDTILVGEDLATKMTCVQLATGILQKHGHDASISTVPQLMTGLVRSIFSFPQFIFFIDEHRTLLPLLERSYPNPTTVDMSKFDWSDPVICGAFVRNIYSGNMALYYNVQKCPPVEYYEILNKCEEKEIRFFGRLLEIPDDCRLVFVADKTLKIEPQLTRIIKTVIINEDLDFLEPMAAEYTSSLFELLSESSAAEILESHEVTRRVIIESERVSQLNP